LPKKLRKLSGCFILRKRWRRNQSATRIFGYFDEWRPGTVRE
jgi:hypothetical protein